MDTRITNIRTTFKADLNDFHKSLGFTPISLNNTPLSKLLKDTTVPAKDQKPLMLKKINQFKVDLGKNNMKKIQQPFTFHGDIDSYLDEISTL